MILKGKPLRLYKYEVPEIRINKHFLDINRPRLEYMYLPQSMTAFTNLRPTESEEFIEDDNRGAVCQNHYVEIDGTRFYLSVKGIGSTTQPFSRDSFHPEEIYSLAGLRDNEIGNGQLSSTSPRFITGELWLRGSPYGGQGLFHASISLSASEMADVTSIGGFRIAPVVGIIQLPTELEGTIKKVFWYRRFGGRIVQEVRLVPSNVRIFFHSGSTLGSNIASIFDQFKLDKEERVYRFLTNFVRSGIAYLTLFTRSMKSNEDGTLSGYDFYDVWLDKDAVLAPDGTIYFVDLEGLDWVTIDRSKVAEKIDDQIYRSLYEFMFAYEQIERERVRRFGNSTDRKIQFEHLLREALKDDEVVAIERTGETLFLAVGNVLGEQSLIKKFPILDR